MRVLALDDSRHVRACAQQISVGDRCSRGICGHQGACSGDESRQLIGAVVTSQDFRDRLDCLSHPRDLIRRLCSPLTHDANHLPQKAQGLQVITGQKVGNALRLQARTIFRGVDILPGLKTGDSYCAGVGVRGTHAKTFASVGSCFDGVARAVRG